MEAGRSRREEKVREVDNELCNTTKTRESKGAGAEPLRLARFAVRMLRAPCVHPVGLGTEAGARRRCTGAHKTRGTREEETDLSSL